MTVFTSEASLLHDDPIMMIRSGSFLRLRFKDIFLEKSFQKENREKVRLYYRALSVLGLIINPLFIGGMMGILLTREENELWLPCKYMLLITGIIGALLISCWLSILVFTLFFKNFFNKYQVTIQLICFVTYAIGVELLFLGIVGSYNPLTAFCIMFLGVIYFPLLQISFPYTCVGLIFPVLALVIGCATMESANWGSLFYQLSFWVCYFVEIWISGLCIWIFRRIEADSRSLWAMYFNYKQENETLRDRIADIDREMEQVADFDSPAEKCIVHLRAIAKWAEQSSGISLQRLENPILTKKQIRAKCSFMITQIAASESLFAPNIVQQLNQGTIRVDDQTKNWLISEFKPRQGNSLLRRQTPSIPSSNISDLARRNNWGSNIIASLQDVNSWNFDIFKFQQSCHTPLTVLTHAVLIHQRVYSLLAEKELGVLLSNIELGYKDNLYHNSLHACDVIQSINALLCMGLREILTDNEVLALILAASTHDIDHPGLNNNFQINTKSEYAIIYNDQSVLENHHLCTFFRLLNHEECNIFSKFDSISLKHIRSLIIELILATDMARHLDFISRFKAKSSEFDMENPADRLLLIQCFFKLADISNVTKPCHISKRWSHLIQEEFFIQGDKEKELEITVSPFMNRQCQDTIKCQIGFIDFFVEPFLSPLVGHLNESGKQLIENLSKNRKMFVES